MSLVPGGWRSIGQAVAAGVAGALLIACGGPVPTPPKAPTPRPDLPAIAAWSDLSWAGWSFGPGPGAVGRRLVAVAADGARIVGVGHEDLRDGGSRAFVAHARDGRPFEPVDDPAFSGLALDDVVAVDDGFVAIGSIIGDPWRGSTSSIVILRSGDGRSWQRLPADPAFEGAYDGLIGAGPGGIIATAGWTDGPTQPLWRSRDGGRTWESIDAAELGVAGMAIGSIEGSAAGWMLAGSVAGGPVVADSEDGLTWRTRPLPPSGEPDRLVPHVERAVASRWGWIATGFEPDDCGFLWFEGDCAAYPIAWWSDGAGDWQVVPAGRAGPGPGYRIVPSGERGFVAVSDAETWVSLDGLAWHPLPGPNDGPALVNDAVVVGDAIVAVGEGYMDAGGTIGWIAVAAPDLEVLH